MVDTKKPDFSCLIRCFEASFPYNKLFQIEREDVNRIKLLTWY